LKKRSVWKKLVGKGYTIFDLGRPAVFLIPAKKLNKKLKNGESVKKHLHRFLIKHFGPYTTSTIPSFGFYKNNKGAIISDECIEYEISFAGKKKIPVLIKKLAGLTRTIGEECIYFKAGQYSCLILSKKKPSH